VKIAEAHISEEYVFGARAPMSNSNWKGPWDCAEFASWCVFQATGVLYGVEPQNNAVLADAFTGFWGQQAQRDGAVISVEDAARTPGASVLRIPSASRIGHIVISDGTGGTVEAHSTNRGVIRHTLTDRRWDMGVLVPGVRYFMNENAVVIAPPAIVFRVTRPMMRGPKIKAIQKALNSAGFSAGEPDGVYGPQTASSVQAFQRDQGLVADGEAGPATVEALGQ
jgi:hypothetical protein